MPASLRTLPVALLLATAATTAARAAEEEPVAAGQPMVDFVLEDAEEEEVDSKKLRGRTVILVVAPEGDSREERQKHSRATKKWFRSIVEKYDGRATVLGMVKLDVSFFVKGMARREMRKNKAVRMAIDWDGDVFARYGRQLPTVVVIDPVGKVRAVVSSHFSESAALDVFATVDALLSGGGG